MTLLVRDVPNVWHRSFTRIAFYRQCHDDRTFLCSNRTLIGLIMILNAVFLSFIMTNYFWIGPVGLSLMISHILIILIIILGRGSNK